MASGNNGVKVFVTGLDMFKNIDMVVYQAVADAMDDIKEDALKTAKGMAPRKTGKLENSGRATRKYVPLKKCNFSISFKAQNKGFDYATWTHEASYKLGPISASKSVPSSRFARGNLSVGNLYVTRTIQFSQKQWNEFIEQNVKRKMAASMALNGNTTREVK